MQPQNKLGKDSNTRNTLGGDVTLQTLEFKIRQLVQMPLDTEFGAIRMADLGVAFNRNGLLDLNGDKLEKALNTNVDAVAQFFAGTEEIGGGDGFAAKLADTVKQLNQENGVVRSRQDGIKRRIKDIDQQIQAKEQQIARTEQSLKDKFSRLEGTIANLKAQQASVAGALGGGGTLSLRIDAQGKTLAAGLLGMEIDVDDAGRVERGLAGLQRTGGPIEILVQRGIAVLQLVGMVEQHRVVVVQRLHRGFELA